MNGRQFNITSAKTTHPKHIFISCKNEWRTPVEHLSNPAAIKTEHSMFLFHSLVSAMFTTMTNRKKWNKM